jgi:hypothetical protein
MSKGSCVLLCIYAVLLAGCGRSEARAPSASAGRVVDSLVSREVALDRFRESLAVTDSLTGGAPSREDLVRAYLKALEKSDTAAFDRLVLTKAEFAYLYYPTAPQALPPYNLSPDLMWFMLFERSNQGVLRALRRYGGQRMELVDAECGTAGSREGENTVFGPCTVRWHDAKGGVSGARLFSQIVERRGRFKFLSDAINL